MFSQILKTHALFHTCNEIKLKSVVLGKSIVPVGLVLLLPSEIPEAVAMCRECNLAHSGLTCVFEPAQLLLGDVAPGSVGISLSGKDYYLLIFDSISWGDSTKLILYTIFPDVYGMGHIDGDRDRLIAEAHLSLNEFLVDIEALEPAILIITGDRVQIVLCRVDLTCEEFTQWFERAGRLSKAIFGGKEYVFKIKRNAAVKYFKTRIITISLTFLDPIS